MISLRGHNLLILRNGFVRMKQCAISWYIFCGVVPEQNRNIMKKVLLLVLGLGLVAPSVVSAQVKVKEKVHYVKVKPRVPKYTKVVSPGANYVYVREDWTWDEGTSQWTWEGNRWVELQPAKTWVEGRWTNTPDGWMWVEGYWK
ncbi:MAG: repeat (2 copies) [Flavipsychrobacter sp.]|jgi:hypothetical protein|nr:repeat (2 copies) [Flavipsychrobacter sp.]